MLYGFWLADHTRYFNFKYPELQALFLSHHLELSNVKHQKDREDWNISRDGDSAKMILFEADQAYEAALMEIAQESVLVKLLVRVLARGETEELMIERMRESIKRTDFDELMRKHGDTFAFVCEVGGKSETLKDKVEKMNKTSFIFDKKHRANLKNPGIELCILQDYSAGSDEGSRAMKNSIFGYIIAKSRAEGPYDLKLYNLPQRPILGPTTLDNELAFLMANMAQVKSDTILLDPYCGTGGLLISAAAMGARCFGSDLDRRVLHGWSVSYLNEGPSATAMPPNRSDVSQNFKAYNLPVPDFVRMDNANISWRRSGWADVILTDPPYGIRAMARDGSDQTREVTCITEDLLNLAAEALKPGGLLVFLLPVVQETKQQSVDDTNMKAVRYNLKPKWFPAYQELTAGRGRYVLSFSKCSCPDSNGERP